MLPEGDRHEFGMAVSSEASMPRSGTAALAAAVPPSNNARLAATRNQGVGRLPPQGGGRSAERLAERGARDGPSKEGSAAPPPLAGDLASRCPGGGLGFQGVGRLLERCPRRESTACRSVTGAGSVRRLVFHAIAFSSNDDRLPVVHQPIDHGGGQGVVHVEDRAPVPEGAVGADHDRAGFVPGGHDLEQQVRAAFVDRQIAQLIEEQKLGARVLPEGLLQRAVELRRGQRVDHVHDAGETDGDAFLAGGVAQGIEQMRLSRSGRPR